MAALETERKATHDTVVGSPLREFRDNQHGNIKRRFSGRQKSCQWISLVIISVTLGKIHISGGDGPDQISRVIREGVHSPSTFSGC